MTPTEIENLLQHGARRRGLAPTVFHGIVEQIAAECGITLGQCLCCIYIYDEDRVKWQKFIAEYQAAKDEAAQIGCDMDQLMKAYSRLHSGSSSQ